MDHAPCKQCPFRRDSAAGYLGESSGKPQEFLSGYWHRDVRMACHMQVDWEAENAHEQAKFAPMCTGIVVMMKNAGKLPRTLDVARKVKSADKNHDLVFSNPKEFCDHHELKTPVEAQEVIPGIKLTWDQSIVTHEEWVDAVNNFEQPATLSNKSGGSKRFIMVSANTARIATRLLDMVANGRLVKHPVHADDAPTTGGTLTAYNIHKLALLRIKQLVVNDDTSSAKEIDALSAAAQAYEEIMHNITPTDSEKD